MRLKVFMIVLLGMIAQSGTSCGSTRSVTDVSSSKFQDSSFKQELEKLRQIIKEQGVFDQMIIYPTFIHVSYKRGGVNRHQVLRKVGSGYAPVKS